MIDLDSLARDLYVDWSSTCSTDEASRRRWKLMPDFGKRAFLSLARVAIARLTSPTLTMAEREREAD